MVMKFLSDSEVITVAMNLEEEGAKFYEEAAKISKNKETKDIFSRLKKEEDEHYKTFKELLETLPGADSKGYFDISEEISAYLNSLVDSGVFKNTPKAGIKQLGEAAALWIGVNAERDSILFYTQAHIASTNPQGREVLSRIIDIEKEHLVTLTNRLRIARKLF